MWWELQRAAARKATPAEQMVLARYALVIDAGVAARQPSEPEINASGYPSVAAHFEVQGEVVVTGRARAEGPGLEAPRVTARRLTVPGIRGVRPVAFETMRDRASLDRAAKVVSTQRNLDKDAELSFRWILK